MFTCKLICCEKLEVHTHHLNETRSVERHFAQNMKICLMKSLNIEPLKDEEGVNNKGQWNLLGS